MPWNIYKSDASSVSIPVNGAEAIWYGTANSAIVLKNGYLGTILLLAPKDGDFKGVRQQPAFRGWPTRCPDPDTRNDPCGRAQGSSGRYSVLVAGDGFEPPTFGL